MPPKAKKSKKEIEEEKSKCTESPILHDLQSLCWMLTKDIEKLEEEKRIQEELERKRLEEEERQRKIEEEKRRVEEEKRKAEELKRLQEEAVRDGLFIFLLA
jgi:hypothetical protein